MRRCLFVCLCLLGLPGLGLPAAHAEPVSARTLSRLLLTDAARAGTRLVATGDYGWIVYSDDGGAHWQRAATPRRALLTALCFADDRHGWAVGHDGLILASADGGSSWQQQRFAPDEQDPLLGVLCRSPTQAIAVGAYGLYLETADGGTHWSRRAIIDGDSHLNAIAAYGPDRLAIAAEAGLVLLSQDGGAHWSPSHPPYEGSYFGALGLPGGALLVFGLRGNALLSSDDGAHWQAVPGTAPSTLMGGDVRRDGTVLLAGSAGALRISRDGGRRFAALPGERAQAYADALLLDAQHALLVGERGASLLALPPQAGREPGPEAAP